MGGALAHDTNLEFWIGFEVGFKVRSEVFVPLLLVLKKVNYFLEEEKMSILEPLVLKYFP